MTVVIIVFSDFVYVDKCIFVSKNGRLRVHNGNTFPK